MPRQTVIHSDRCAWLFAFRSRRGWELGRPSNWPGPLLPLPTPGESDYRTNGLGRFNLSGLGVYQNSSVLIQRAGRWHHPDHRCPMPRRLSHRAAPCTNATAHPQRGHHRTTSYTSCSVRSPGTCTPQRQARRPDTIALGPRSRVPLPPRHLVPPFYSRWPGHPKSEGTCPVSVNQDLWMRVVSTFPCMRL